MKKLFMLFILVSSAAFAQTGKRTELKPFVGTWHCTGVVFASDMGPEHPTMATAMVKWALNSNWLDIHYAETKTAKNPHPYALNAYWGSNQDKLVDGFVNNMGGYGSGESKGWEGDQLVFTGPFHTGAADTTARDTFVKKGANGLMHIAELQDSTGNWKKMVEENCKK